MGLHTRSALLETKPSGNSKSHYRLYLTHKLKLHTQLTNYIIWNSISYSLHILPIPPTTIVLSVIFYNNHPTILNTKYNICKSKYKVSVVICGSSGMGWKKKTQTNPKVYPCVHPSKTQWGPCQSFNKWPWLRLIGAIVLLGKLVDSVVVTHGITHSTFFINTNALPMDSCVLSYSRWAALSHMENAFIEYPVSLYIIYP